jgi:hypothetical protein
VDKDYIKKVKIRYRDITFVTVYRDSCFFYVEFTAIPSFYELPLEPHSKEFTEIEKAGSEYIRGFYTNLREIFVMLCYQKSILDIHGNQRKFLVFRRIAKNTPIRIVETIQIGAITRLNSEIIVDFKVYGKYGRPFKLCKKGSPEWSQLENGVLERLCGMGMIKPGTYELSSISADNKFHFSKILDERE